MRRTHLALLVVLLLPAFAMPAAAAPVNGTVTVANGTASGDAVTVTPMNSNYQRAGQPVNVTVDGDSFAADAADAPLYFVRLRHGDAAHYALVRNGTAASIRLGATITGRVVGPNGTPRSNVQVALQSELGPVVDATTTGENGSFSFGPVQTDANYTVKARVAGAPYRTSVRTGANASSVTLRTPPPTEDAEVLTATATGTQPAGHLLRVIAPKNGSQKPTVVETFSLRNTADRPFVGPVTITPPENATPVAGMFRGRRVPVGHRNGTLTINATIAANETERVGVAYALDGRTLSKPVQYSPARVAVVLQGYDADATDHSANLRVGNAPISMLTNAGALEDGETLRVTLPSNSTGDSAQATATPSDGADGTGMPSFPAARIGLLLALAIGGGIVAYRVTG